VVATVGTTFKGAIDPVFAIQEALKGQESYLHVDAALFGGYLPHTPYAHLVSQRQMHYDSIAISGHKFFGFPHTLGLFITKRSTFDSFLSMYGQVHNPEFIGHVPGSITCSRNAIGVAEFYFFTTEEAVSRQVKDANAVLALTDGLFQRMQNEVGHLMPCRAHQASNIVYFMKPEEWIVKKYMLATMHVQQEDGRQTEYAHAVVMPHARKSILDRFMDDLKSSLA